MKISAYTTTFNCLDRGYPFLECLEDLSSFADEVCVADGGSSDDTLNLIKESFPNVRIKTVAIDMSHPRWAIYSDGYLKNEAREMCTGDVLWQSDTDEFIHENNRSLIRELCETVHEKQIGIALPVLEFWGSLACIRADIHPKPRITPNNFFIKHGIPESAKEFDTNGHEYPRPYESDTCDYINTTGNVRVSFHQFNQSSPISIWHVSWLDLVRKIENYRDHWHHFHNSMYNLQREDTPENNVMFDKPWAEVDEEDIHAMAQKLYDKGPRVFHEKKEDWSGSVIKLPNSKSVPRLVVNWFNQNVRSHCTYL